MRRFLAAATAMLQAKLRALSSITPDDLALPTVNAETVIAKCVPCLSADFTNTAVLYMRF